MANLSEIASGSSGSQREPTILVLSVLTMKMAADWPVVAVFFFVLFFKELSHYQQTTYVVSFITLPHFNLNSSF